MHKPGLFGMNGFMVFLLTCLSVVAHGQQPGFLILIDAENKQAFTIRIGDQFYSSSSQGHLVLAQLKDSSYSLNLRFPKSSLPEISFPVILHHKDLGFQLRGADTSWVLYNWQTKETIHSVIDPDSSRILDRGIKREDGFSKLMAAVVADSSVMYNTFTESGFNRDTSNARSPGKAVDSVQLTVNNSVAKAVPLSAGGGQSKKPAPAEVIVPNVVTPPPTSNGQTSTAKVALPTTNRHPPTNITPRIKKLREVTLKISRKIVYQDIGKDGQIDTITLFVFFEKKPDILAVKPEAAASLASSKPVIKPVETTCTQIANDDDVAFLRSAILKVNTEDEKISIASEAFAMKCFTVIQVRLLASLFVSDKDKYRLMDAAHLHVSDRDHFRELVDMLTDKNFQRKFLVMADKRS